MSINIKKTIFFLLFIAYLQMSHAAYLPAEPAVYKIGVLSDRSKDITLKEWYHTAKRLSDLIPNAEFVIVPMEYNNMLDNIKNGKVDFFIANPVIYVVSEVLYGAQKIATVSRYRTYSSSKMGGVLFSRADRSDIRSYKDLRNKKIAAVSINSFGGYLAVNREFKELGLELNVFAKDIDFLGSQDLVVMSVMNDMADAGIVRTGVLERLCSEGKVDLSSLNVLELVHVTDQNKNGNPPFLCSTRLYPEWVFAKLKNTSESLSKNVLLNLLRIRRDDIAAYMGDYGGWTVPSNYQSVHECLRYLKLSPYEKFGTITLSGVIRAYWPVLLAILFIVIFLILIQVHLSSLNIKLLDSRVRLEREIKQRTELQRLTTNKNVELERLNKNLAVNELALKNILYDMKKTHSELNDAQTQLIQSEKLASIGQLAAGIAHEINNPVGFIGSNLNVLDKYLGDLSELLRATEVVKQTVSSGDMKSVELAVQELQDMEDSLDLNFILTDVDNILRESKEGINRIKNIVLDLKTFSRVSDETRTSCDINQVLDRVLNIVWNEIKYKSSLIKNYGDIPECDCNAQQIGQVFINILVNASQAIDDKGEIRLKTYTDGKWVYVDIQDTGKGIPADIAGKIFEPFFTTKAPGKGTGLGLSISYDIIKKHEGDITVKSVIGEGTTFTVKLPAGKQHK